MQSRSISKDKQTQSGRLSKRQIVFLVLSVLFAIMIFCFSARNGEESTEDSYTVGMEFGRIVHPDFKNWSEEAQLAFAAKVDHPIRKLAHATEYAVFAMLLCGVWLDVPKKTKGVCVIRVGELRRCMRRRMSFISCLFLDGADR
ncbi:MAG: VanZ family protein [Coprococcus sp.]